MLLGECLEEKDVDEPCVVGIRGGEEKSEYVGNKLLPSVKSPEPDRPVPDGKKKVRFACQFPWRQEVNKETPTNDKIPPSVGKSVSVPLQDAGVILRPPRSTPEPVKIILSQPLKTSNLDKDVCDTLKVKDFIFETIQAECQDLSDAGLAIIAELVSQKALSTCSGSPFLPTTDEVWAWAVELGLDNSARRPSSPARPPDSKESPAAVTSNKLGSLEMKDRPSLLLNFEEIGNKEVLFRGLASKRAWRASDCGQNLILGGRLRKNSCVLLAVAKSAGVDLGLLFSQVQQEAWECMAHHSGEQHTLVTPSQKVVLQHAHDFLTPDHMLDITALASFAPSCLMTSRLVIIQAVNPVSNEPKLFIIEPSSHQATNTAFVLLHKKHAWSVQPPVELRVTTNAQFANWRLVIESSGFEVSEHLYRSWRDFWNKSLPDFGFKEVPWPPSQLCPECKKPWFPQCVAEQGLKGGNLPSFSVSNQSGEGRQCGRRENDLDIYVDNRLLKGEKPTNNARELWAEKYWAFVKEAPEYSVQAWNQVQDITENLIAACDHSLVAAVSFLRGHEHPGRVVCEREDMSHLVHGMETLPPEIRDLLLRRASDGVPTYFPIPPPRVGEDRMHDSAVIREDEVRRTIYVEVQKGKTLIVSSEFRERFLKDYPCSPLARVPKYDAQGRERETGRVIRNHSYPRGRSVNDFATLPSEIEITLPKIQDLILDVLALKKVLPNNIPILLSKRDVNGAFEWVGLSADMTPYLGSFIQDPEQRGFGNSFAFPMRCTFGFIHSPSEWHLISMALDIAVSGTYMATPRRDGPWPITCRCYVDDLMLICPDLGWRPWIVSAEVQRVLEAFLGPGALNDKKLREEGQWSTKAVFLGFLLCTETETLSLSKEKLDKARFYLNEPKFNWGNKVVTIHDLQVLLGRLYHWTVVVRPAQCFLAGLLRMISKGGPLVVPGFDDDSAEDGWIRFWSDLQCLRLIFNQYENLIQVSITAPFLTTIDPIERLRRAQLGDKFYVIGTDATEWSIAGVFYEMNQGYRLQLPTSVLAAIRAAAAPSTTEGRAARRGRSLCMGVTELLAIVGSLLQWGSLLGEGVVVVVTDNQNVLRWVRSRGAKNLFAQALLRIITRLEILGGFQVWSEDIRSEENLLPDCLSRLFNSEGITDQQEIKRWNDLQKDRVTPITQVPLTWSFPSEWFNVENQGPSKWVMRLPGETEEAFFQWNPKVTSYHKKVTPGFISTTLPSVEKHNKGCNSFLSSQNSQNPSLSSKITPGSSLKNKIPQGFNLDKGQVANFPPDTAELCGRLPLNGEELVTHLQLVAAAVSQLDQAILAVNTRSKYDHDIKAWQDFQDLTGDPHLLEDHTVPILRQVEMLKNFIGYLGIVKGLRYTTILGYLSAIRYLHVQQGLSDPTSRPSVRNLIRGLKRLQGAMESKRPVTPAMLLYIHSHLNLQQAESTCLWAALVTGFMFLLRASEFLGEGTNDWDKDKVLLWRDLKWKVKGRYVADPRVADEVQITIRASKTDQFRSGTTRSLTLSHTTICVVTALRALYLSVHHPDPTLPVFYLPDVGIITRSYVGSVLRSAASELGEEVRGISTHSLRGGGATALWHQGRSVEEICFLGRWTSDCWKIYVHFTTRLLEGVATDLATASYQVIQTSVRNSLSSPPKVIPAGVLIRGVPQVGARWWDNASEFVVVGTYFSRSFRRRLTCYIPRSNWDSLKLPSSVSTSTLLEHLWTIECDLERSSPEEVCQWIKECFKSNPGQYGGLPLLTLGASGRS